MAKLSAEELNKLLEEAPRNDKGQPIIPDDIFMDNLRNLPTGTRSDDGKYAKDGGYLNPPKKGSERAVMIGKMGGEKTAETYARRKSFRESITVLLNQKCEDGETLQDKIVAAMANKAMEGCVGAFEALRDTVGEKPSDQVSLDVMTDGDKQLMEILKKRLGYDGSGSVKEQ
jgi:hypothetical protein